MTMMLMVMVASVEPPLLLVVAVFAVVVNKNDYADFAEWRKETNNNLRKA